MSSKQAVTAPVVTRILVGDDCYETYPCQHNVVITYNDGTTARDCMTGPSIYKMFQKWGIACTDEHIAYYGSAEYMQEQTQREAERAERERRWNRKVTSIIIGHKCQSRGVYGCQHTICLNFDSGETEVRKDEDAADIVSECQRWNLQVPPHF